MSSRNLDSDDDMGTKPKTSKRMDSDSDNDNHSAKKKSNKKMDMEIDSDGDKSNSKSAKAVEKKRKNSNSDDSDSEAERTKRAKKKKEKEKAAKAAAGDSEDEEKEKRKFKADLKKQEEEVAKKNAAAATIAAAAAAFAADSTTNGNGNHLESKSSDATKSSRSEGDSKSSGPPRPKGESGEEGPPGPEGSESAEADAAAMKAAADMAAAKAAGTETFDFNTVFDNSKCAEYYKNIHSDPADPKYNLEFGDMDVTAGHWEDSSNVRIGLAGADMGGDNKKYLRIATDILRLARATPFPWGSFQDEEREEVWRKYDKNGKVYDNKAYAKFQAMFTNVGFLEGGLNKIIKVTRDDGEGGSKEVTMSINVAATNTFISLRKLERTVMENLVNRAKILKMDTNLSKAINSSRGQVFGAKGKGLCPLNPHIIINNNNNNILTIILIFFINTRY